MYLLEQALLELTKYFISVLIEKKGNNSETTLDNPAKRKCKIA